MEHREHRTIETGIGYYGRSILIVLLPDDTAEQGEELCEHFADSIGRIEAGFTAPGSLTPTKRVG